MRKVGVSEGVEAVVDRHHDNVAVTGEIAAVRSPARNPSRSRAALQFPGTSCATSFRR
jgi:hypothetical protein